MYLWATATAIIGLLWLDNVPQIDDSYNCWDGANPSTSLCLQTVFCTGIIYWRPSTLMVHPYIRKYVNSWRRTRECFYFLRCCWLNQRAKQDFKPKFGSKTINKNVSWLLVLDVQGCSFISKRELCKFGIIFFCWFHIRDVSAESFDHIHANHGNLEISVNIFQTAWSIKTVGWLHYPDLHVPTWKQEKIISDVEGQIR